MSKYTLEYIQNVLKENGSAQSASTPAQGSRYTLEYIQSVLDGQNKNSSQATPGGPLQVAKGGGGQTAAPAAQSAPAPQPKKETNMLYALLGGPVQLDEQAQQRMRQAIESTKPAAVPAAPENGMSEDELLPFREIGQRGAAARVAQLTKAPQAVKKERSKNAYKAALEARENPLLEGVSYTANQAVNTFKNVGSVLFGQGKDYVNAYEQEWKRRTGKQYTPLEEAGKALARNLNAGVGQGFQGVAMSADLLLPDNWTPNGVQKGLDWVKNTGERATEYANEFNREQGYGEMGPQLLQAIGGMAPDLALAFFTAGGSAAAKIPQMATAGTGVKETAKQIVQQAVENPQFWLSFARTWGMDYQEALDRGATESQALAAASLGSAVNAAIEVGGGVQTQFQEGAESGLRGVVKSALEEGSEEVGQNIVSNAVNGLIFDPSAPLVSLSDERAVLNPLREANSFAVGAMAGGLMSAPGNLMRAGNRPGAANAQQAVFQPDAKTAETQAPAVNSEAPAVEMPAGAETYRRLAGLDDSAASRAQGAVTALDVELLQNLARQEQIKMRVQLLVRDPAKTDAVLQSWGELSKLMDRESEIRVQKEVFQRQAEIGAEAVAAVHSKAQRRTTSAQLVEKLRENIPALNQEQPVARITGQEFQKSNVGIFEQVSQFFKKLGNKVERPGFGEVELLPRGVKNSVAHGLGSRKAATFASVPDVIRFGKQIDVQENWKGRGYDTYVFAAPIDVGGEKNFVAVVVTKDAQTNRYYLHEVLDENGSLIKMGTKKDATPLIKTGVTAESGVTGKALASSISSIANLEGNVNEGSAQEKSTGAYQVPDTQSANGGTSMTRPELTPAASIVSTRGQEVNDGSARNEDTIDLGGARRWLDQKNEARAHADENFMAMGDMEASRLQVNSPENRLRPMRQAERANVEGEDTGRMPELPREVVRDLRPGKKLTGKDIDRVMDSVAPKGGAGRAFLNEHLIKPFFAAKKAYALDSVSNGRKFARQMKALGLAPGSKAAWYLQWYREGLRPVVGADGVLMEEAAPYTLENLKADRPQDWQNIVKAEELYGQWADDYFEIENRSLERVYPNAEQEIRERLDKLDAQAKGFGIKLNEAQAALRKIDPADELESAAAWDNYERIRKQKAANEAEVERLQEQLTSGEALRGKRLQYRKNYVPHRYETQRGFRGLKNILFNADQNIDPHLVGVSDYTKPKSRWAGWMQHRSNDVFQGMDPVSAFLEYMKEVEYKAHLDPVIAQARTLTEELRTKTEATRTENNLVEWLEKWTNDLAGKTGYWDRPVQVDHSRKSMAVLQWLNSRAKANAVMGNLSSALSQVYNLPNAVGMLKNPADMAKGAARYGKLLAGDAETRALVGQSGFLTERYALQNLDSELRQLGADDVDSPAALWRWLGQKPERMAAFMLEVGDKTVAQYTWLSAYEQAVRKGEADPLAYADELTRKSVGGRGVGEMPLVLRNKVVNLIAPFQVETMNAWNMMKDKVREKDLVGLFLTFLATYVLNSIRKEYLDGREVGFDPISAVLDSWEQSGQDEDATMGSRLTATGFRMGGEVLSNMPFGDMVASVALGADSQTAKNLFGEGDPTRFGTGNIGLSALADPVIQLGSAAVNHKPISNVDLKNPLFQLLPSYGGKQLQRSVQAAQDMGLLSNGPFGLPFSGERNEAPGSYNNQGNLRFPIDTGNGLNVAKGLSWGSYATNEGREYLQSGAKPKSVGYTEAYKAGYSTSILDALYPSSSQSAGKATYQQMTGGAPGAAKVDSWMEALMEYNGSKNMMPSNTTTSVTVDGETVKLTGPQALDFAQTKVQTSYSILDALRPQAGNYDRQVQARYAARAQDYAQAVAKEQVLGVEPNAGSWVEELQNYSGVKGKAVNDKLLNALLASSIVEETKPDYYPNGNPVSGSRKRKTLASLRAAGFDTRTAMQMWEVFG